jgi:hypothetical protein
MAQTYSSSLAIDRMRHNLCPECGNRIRDHDGWGGPGCSLTDNGVAARIAKQRELDAKSKA